MTDSNLLSPLYLLLCVHLTDRRYDDKHKTIIISSSSSLSSSSSSVFIERFVLLVQRGVSDYNIKLPTQSSSWRWRIFSLKAGKAMQGLGSTVPDLAFILPACL